MHLGVIIMTCTQKSYGSGYLIGIIASPVVVLYAHIRMCSVLNWLFSCSLRKVYNDKVCISLATVAENFEVGNMFHFSSCPIAGILRSILGVFLTLAYIFWLKQ